MTIDDAIRTLKHAKSAGCRNIVLAYWDAAAFGRTDDDSWASDSSLLDDDFDWSGTHDDMTHFLESHSNMRTQ